jgi:amino acid adenylation domain-containing protein
MFAAVLAVLKTGAAYVPMDPDYPAERLAMMVQDAAPCLVVTERALAAVFPAAGAPLLCLDDLARERDDASPPGVATSPEDPAYVIFTSGSTGRPKGVQVPHRAVTNFLLSMQQEPGLTAGDVLLAVTTLSFDISVLEIFLPLVTGATVVAADRETIADAGRLAALIRNCGATVMQATPTTWRMLLAAGWSGSPTLKILCGGEAFPRDLAANLVDKCASLWNMYGPTETTVWSTCAQVTDTSRAPLIGRPIAGTTVHGVDEDLELVPPGVAGELLIGGTGVTLGYLGQPELTRERFLPDRFAPRNGESEPGLLYRTGDLVRFQADGSLEYLSRTDDQVKVRGFRIELGEIEATLSQHSHVGRAVVTCYEARPGDTRLVAYILPKGRPGPAAAELREHLRATLPEYMVPQHFVEIGEIPLTPAGKIDRRRLPPPELNASRIQGQFQTPGTETERLLHGIWSRILQSDAIDINDSFFDIGGHSLLAVEAFSGIRAAFGIELPLATLFDAPTIHTLGRRIDAAVYAAGSPGSVRQGDDDREEVIF